MTSGCNLPADWKSTVAIPPDFPAGSSGGFKVERFKIDNEGAHLYNLMAFIQRFEGQPLRYVRPGTHTRLMGPSPRAVADEGNLCWMSDTPAEVADHEQFFARLQGAETVLVNGLGIGLCVAAVLNLSTSVGEIDIVERSQDVIDLVEPYWRNACELRGVQLRVFQGDAYTKTWPKLTSWDLAWHDIWEDISPDNLPLMAKMLDKYEGRCDWQGCWSMNDAELGKAALNEFQVINIQEGI